VGWGPVYNDDQVGSDPQVEARDMIVKVPGTESVKVVRLPLLFNGLAGRVSARAPRLGQHTRAVLEEIGYAAGRMDELSAAGVVLIDEHGES
jgi:CoA:oxalate CoA-transferase